MQANCFIDSLLSNENNSNSAPALGAGGRGFESRYPDLSKSRSYKQCNSFFISSFASYSEIMHSWKDRINPYPTFVCYYYI